METTRAGIAIYKINYQSDFTLTVVCDVEWGTPFCIKFWTGEPAQAYYVGWDGKEYRNCKVVESDPSKLLVLFDDHHLPVGELKMQIVYHATIEDFPNAIVDEVTNSMKVMAFIDGKNQKVALDFEGEEAAELQFELPAYANEAQRIANEEQRIANEQSRIEAEQQRIDNEQTRQDNEAQRITQETARVNEYAGLKADAVAATDAANDAATLANQKAQLAADKAALADAAATLANQKAQLAADKAVLADAAATLANQKAEYADTQGDYAKEQGDYAKEQGDTALADHRRAESDHETATSDHTIAANDHTQAGNDHTRAESDHSTAADDHTLAASDHSTAAADHTLAASDHSTAADDHTLAASDHSTAANDHTQAGNDHTRAESDHTRAESDHAAVEVYVDSLGAFDISSYHATGGVLAKYADLTAALGTNGVNIPEAIRKGGMSVKFVHSSDKYVQYRLMSDEWSTNTEDWAISDDGVYVENSEFVEVHTDAEDKILWAIQKDGNIYFGAGCPQQVKDYIEEKISSLSLDEYEDIVSFLQDFLGTDTTLKIMLDDINANIDTKVDKEEGKSLIDLEYASTKSTIDNPEFLEVTTDSEDKVLEGIQQDGTKVIGGDLNVGDSATISGDIKVFGNMEVSGVSYKVVENPEYLAAWVDAENKIVFGIKIDGKTYVGDTDFLDDIENIKAFLANFNDKNIDWDALTSITAIESPEYIEAITDSEGRLIAGRTPDGAAFENVGFSTPKVSISGHIIENFEDTEGRREITTDAEGKIVSYRDSEGVKHEDVGIETNELKANSFQLPQNTKMEVEELAMTVRPFKKYDLPDFGYVNLISETFYLTADGWSSYQNDVELRQDYPDTDANALNKITLSNFYIKGTNIRLDFYAATKVTKIESNYYVTNTLTEIEDPDTNEISYEVNENSIEVRQCVDVPPISAWSVDKNTKHQCVVNIDFGGYLSGTFYVLVSFQGSSTLSYRKRNFRFTFYKNNQYAKKLKLKIGELPRQSGYNLKANWTDNSRIKELSMYRLLLSVWKEKPLYKQFPWSNKEDVTPYYGATGFIQGFNIQVKVGGTFYGLYMYGLKKDSGNYMIEDDTKGIFVCAENAHWSTADASSWENEIEDEMPQDTADALNDFFLFLRSGNVARETAPQRMDILPWLDYYICLQVFFMPDNIGRNMILYSDENKYKFTPFFYDLDLSLNFTDYAVDFYTAPWPDGTYEKDFLPYNLMKNLYWDEILGRYKELRKTVLSNSNIKYVFDTVLNSIPNTIINAESAKWGNQNIVQSKNSLVEKLISRINWLDYNIFNN